MTRWFSTTLVLVLVPALLAGWLSRGVERLSALDAQQPPQSDPGKPKLDLHGDPLPAGAIARMGTLRWRAGNISCLDISPDGTLLAAGDVNGSVIRLLDMTTGREVRRCEGRASILSFSADGSALYAFGPGRGSVRFEVRCWDTASGKPLHSFEIKGRFGPSLATFHPGMKAVILAYERDDQNREDVKVLVRDVNSGKPIDLPDELLRSRNLAFSPDGSIVALIAKDFSVCVYDRARNEITHRLGKLPGALLVVFSRTGKRVAVAARSSKVPVIQIWDTVTGKHVSRCEGHDLGLLDLAFAPDEKTLVSAGPDLTLRVWDVATGKERRRFSTPGGLFPVGVQFTAADKPLIVTGWNGLVHLLDPQSGDNKTPFPEHDEVGYLAITPDGRTLATGGSWRGSLRLWDMETGKEVRCLKPPGFTLWSKDRQDWEYRTNTIRSLAMSPDGKTLVVVCSDGVELWDLSDIKGPRHLHKNDNKNFETRVFRGTLSGDGKTLACWHDQLHLWDMPAGRRLRSLPPPDQFQFTSAAFSPDGRLLATGGYDLIVRLWDATSGHQLLQLGAEDRFKVGSVSNIVFAPDGRTLAAGTGYGEIRLWEIASCKERLRFRVKYGADLGMCFSPDGTVLVMAGGIDHDIRFHRAATGEIVHRISGHDGAVTALAFTPDGTRLASDSHDLTALIWDVSTLLPRLRRKESLLTAKELELIWEQLAGADVRQAHRVIWSLVPASGQSVTFLDKVLRTSKIPDDRRLPQLIRALGSDKFAVRDQATRELEDFGGLARSALSRELAKELALEARLRIDRLLKRTEGKSAPSEVLRALRALEVLEASASPEAREVLESLARHEPGSLLAREAHASVMRLSKRMAAP